MDANQPDTDLPAMGPVPPERAAQVAAMLAGIGIDEVIVHGTDELVDWLGDLEQIETVTFAPEPDSVSIRMHPANPVLPIETADVRAVGELTVVQVEHQPGRRDQRRVRIAVSTVVYDWTIDTFVGIGIVAPAAPSA